MKVSNTSERLKQIMKERNLRQVDILRLTEYYCKTYNVKMNKSDISQYCSGKVEPNQDKLFILSAALNVNISWLMGYDVPSEPVRFAGAKRDYCIYKALEEGLRSFNWEITLSAVEGDTVQYTISNDVCSITVPEEYISDIESKLKQFLINELKEVFIKQNNMLFEIDEYDSLPVKDSLIKFPSQQKQLNAAYERTDIEMSENDIISTNETSCTVTFLSHFKDVKEAKEFLKSRNLLAAWQNKEPTDEDIINMANAIWETKD